MTVAKDSRLEIYRGFPFSVTYTVNDETGNPIDLSGKTFTSKVRNFSEEEYQDFGTVTTQPNSLIGAIRLDGTIEHTELLLKEEYEPSEQNPEISARIIIVDENGIPYMDINVAVME